MPPQIPNRSSCSSAYSRQSARTSQLRHTRLASRVDPPFSGKNASGSVCAHSARSCQPSSSTSSGLMKTCASGTMTSVTAHPPSPPIRSPRSHHCLGGGNHINEITLACLASSQARKVIMVAPLSEMRDKSREESGGHEPHQYHRTYLTLWSHWPQKLLSWPLGRSPAISAAVGAGTQT